ncbi:hypothetical protein HJG60_009512 [Phyllostomus discolor]|uniref:Uncharacterized protein n=1 Tax=Phyllostomus discolor TaxID=89673 RepID=A0A834D906_9CHIR|nr:hypothetical protein HJG60_009512 [Phyllostomus discolor]
MLVIEKKGCPSPGTSHPWGFYFDSLKILTHHLIVQSLLFQLITSEEGGRGYPSLGKYLLVFWDLLFLLDKQCVRVAIVMFLHGPADWPSLGFFFLFFLKIFILSIFRERGREGESEGEKHQLVASHTPRNGDLARNPGVCPDQKLNRRPFVPVCEATPNPLSHTSQGSHGIS